MVGPTNLNPPQGPPFVLDGSPADELPDVGIEASEFLLNREKPPGVRDGGLDLPPVADNARIGKERGDLLFSIPGYRISVETVEGPPEVLALLQYREPAQPGLGALKEEHLEEFPVSVDGHAPLTVVVFEQEGGRPGPFASFLHPGILVPLWK
jgi:hypothetical protein